MPSVINLGVLNVNTPQQNASVIGGESILTGMDANRLLGVHLACFILCLPI